MKVLETKSMQDNGRDLNYYYFDDIKSTTNLLQIFKLMLLQGLIIDKVKVVFEFDDSYQNNELIYTNFDTFSNRLDNIIFDEIDSINFWGFLQDNEIYGQISLKQNRLFTEVNTKKKEMNDRVL